MTSALRVSAVALVFLMACAHKAPSGTIAKLTPSDLFPLRPGNAWSYDVDTGEPSTTLGVTRVEKFDGRVAKVRTGRKAVLYEVLDEGIRVPPGDEWLLRSPLELGATWTGRGGRDARLASTDLSIETQAGSFERCVEVVETGGKLELEVRTVYCPGVGPVRVESTMRSKVNERVLKVTAELRGYDVSPSAASLP
ncbi:MAG: hypothetical protein ACN4G0_11160 [Polyangiales bacterium]